jgi:hypothetical protein
MKKLEIEGLDNEPQNEANNDERDHVLFSSKLVGYFSQQIKTFKENNKASLTIDNLKKVYCHGARLAKNNNIEDLNLYALARIHMFLRMKSGDMEVTKQCAPDTIKATKLELEDSQKNMRFSSFIDISESWIPNEDDLEKAKKEMDENDLKHEYDNIEDLYLEYEPIKPKWD